MNEDSTLWKFRNDLPNYQQFAANGFCFDNAYVCMGTSPYIVLLSAESEIHIHNIIKVSKCEMPYGANYSIEHLQFYGLKAPQKHFVNIQCRKM